MLARDNHTFYRNLLKGKTNMFRAGSNQNNIACNLNITKCQKNPETDIYLLQFTFLAPLNVSVSRSHMAA